ncbi:MAG: hypothetical protein C6W59_01180 [Paenibacillaceae bacterium]|nr:MAG: hypothetical protein C6W59_01180 [Paenibacillaceae bacterium]
MTKLPDFVKWNNQEDASKRGCKLNKRRIGLLCALLAFVCVVPTDTAHTREQRLIRNMLQSYADAARDGRSHGQRLILSWSGTPEGGQLIAP